MSLDINNRGGTGLRWHTNKWRRVLGPNFSRRNASDLYACKGDHLPFNNTK